MARQMLGRRALALVGLVLFGVSSGAEPLLQQLDAPCHGKRLCLNGACCDAATESCCSSWTRGSQPINICFDEGTMIFSYMATSVNPLTQFQEAFILMMESHGGGNYTGHVKDCHFSEDVTVAPLFPACGLGGATEVAPLEEPSSKLGRQLCRQVSPSAAPQCCDAVNADCCSTEDYGTLCFNQTSSLLAVTAALAQAPYNTSYELRMAGARGGGILHGHYARPCSNPPCSRGYCEPLHYAFHTVAPISSPQTGAGAARVLAATLSI